MIVFFYLPLLLVHVHAQDGPAPAPTMPTFCEDFHNDREACIAQSTHRISHGHMCLFCVKNLTQETSCTPFWCTSNLTERLELLQCVRHDIASRTSVGRCVSGSEIGAWFLVFFLIVAWCLVFFLIVASIGLLLLTWDAFVKRNDRYGHYAGSSFFFTFGPFLMGMVVYVGLFIVFLVLAAANFTNYKLAFTMVVGFPTFNVLFVFCVFFPAKFKHQPTARICFLGLAGVEFLLNYNLFAKNPKQHLVPTTVVATACVLTYLVLFDAQNKQTDKLSLLVSKETLHTVEKQQCSMPCFVFIVVAMFATCMVVETARIPCLIAATSVVSAHNLLFLKNTFTLFIPRWQMAILWCMWVVYFGGFTIFTFTFPTKNIDTLFTIVSVAYLFLFVCLPTLFQTNKLLKTDLLEHEISSNSSLKTVAINKIIIDY